MTGHLDNGALESPRRICLIGAGTVSRVHAEALRDLPDAKVTAVCDLDPEKAQVFAAERGLEHVFTSVRDVIASGACNFAHVLVPPPAHLEVAQQLIDARIGVFLEKPMGCSTAGCRSLVRQADSRKIPLGVNHNAIFYPAHMELRRQLAARKFGALQHLIVVANFPSLNQAPPEHWMLQRPENLIFESGVHPLSQIYDLAGPLLLVDPIVSGRHQLPSGVEYFDTWQASMRCERATAQLFLSFGGSVQTWLETAICEDGILTAEVDTDRIIGTGKTRWATYLDLPQRAVSRARQELAHGIDAFAREALSAVRPSSRRDPYFMSMRGSVAAFYNGAASGETVVDGDSAADVVSMCEAVGHHVAGRASAPAGSQTTTRMTRADAVVLGGTGFIGRALVDQMVRAGMTVRVMARNPCSRGEPSKTRMVETFRGDISDPSAVMRAIKGARFVVHLAHGGSFAWESLDDTMLRPAARIAEACLEYGVERVVYAGTIASLYLGHRQSVVTGATPTDPHLYRRGPYEWGKAQIEDLFRTSFREQSLPVCIVRPGIVLGAGGTPFHSGFGIWRGDIHCLGWNLGKNPLPLVLVSDVAAAMILALDNPVAPGKSYNLVGDVRISARDCVADLRTHVGRPLVFHPRYPAQHQALQASKWLVKRATGTPVSFPSYRGVKSMGCVSAFDCSDVKRDLGWQPLQDRAEFVDRALHVYASRRSHNAEKTMPPSV